MQSYDRMRLQREVIEPCYEAGLFDTDSAELLYNVLNTTNYNSEYIATLISTNYTQNKGKGYFPLTKKAAEKIFDLNDKTLVKHISAALEAKALRKNLLPIQNIPQQTNNVASINNQKAEESVQEKSIANTGLNTPLAFFAHKEVMQKVAQSQANDNRAQTKLGLIADYL